MTPPTEGGDLKVHHDLEALRTAFFEVEAEADRLRALGVRLRDALAASSRTTVQGHVPQRHPQSHFQHPLLADPEVRAL